MISSNSPLVLVGCGNMGRALAEGWRSSFLDEDELVIIVPSEDKRIDLTHHLGVTCYDSISALPESLEPSAFCLAFKPHHAEEALPEITQNYGDLKPLMLSVLAGKTIPFYEDLLWEDSRVVRIMPNTPSTIGRGMSLCLANDAATEEDKELVTDLMKSVGELVWLDKPEEMDSGTAISGSGPAYVFYFIECFINAALQLGLSEEVARTLVLHTVSGAADYALRSSDTAGILREKVTSPGGTTQAALDILMNKDDASLKQLMQQATSNAVKRSKELAQS